MAKKKKAKAKQPKKTNTTSASSTPETKVAAKATEKATAKPPVDWFADRLGQKSWYVLLVLLGLIASVVYGGFWFGEHVFLFKDIGSDSINGLYPIYYWNAATWEAEGSFPTWSFATGMGQNTILMNLGDPFVWLMYLAGKDAIIHWLAYIEALKVVLAGLCFYAYLRTVGMSYLAGIMGGLCYAFSGFMMVGSGWYLFTIEGLYFAFALLAFEQLLKGKWQLFPIAFMLISIWQPTDAYLFALCLGTYGTVRILDQEGFEFKNLLKRYGQMVVWGGLGLGLGGFLLLPSLELMLNSPRVLGDASFFDSLQSQSAFALVEGNLWQTTKARLLATNLLVNPINGMDVFQGAMNFLEAPAMYCGLIPLLLLPQAFAFMNKQARILYGGLLALYVLPSIFPFLRYAFWLFLGDYFRFYSLVVIFILVYLGAYALHQIYQQKRVSWLALGTGALLILGLLFSIDQNNVVNVNTSVQNFTLLLLLLQVLAVAALAIPSFRNIGAVALLGLLCTDLTSVSNATQNDRVRATAAEFEAQKIGYNDYTRDAVSWIKSIDPSFYRIEKNYASYNRNLILHTSTNDAKVQGYMGTRSYHSFNQLNYVRFLSALDIIDPTIESQTRWLGGVGMRPMINFLLGNKYFLSDQGKNANIGFGYQYKHQVGNISIYENSNFVPFGVLYDKVMPRSTFDQLDPKLIQNIYGAKDIALLKACIIEDEDLTAITLNKLPVAQTNAQAYPFQAMTNDIQYLKQDAFQLEHFSNTNFTGKISVKGGNKMLFFPVPFDQGWSATVNGQAAELYQVHVGFTGLYLPAGDHQIEMTYHTPYLATGTWLSLACLLLYTGLWWWSKKTGSTTEGTEDSGLNTDNNKTITRQIQHFREF